MKSATIAASVAALLALAVPAWSAEEDLFPFVVSYDSPDNATNVSGWLDRPAGRLGFVRAEEGHFAVGQGAEARPIRFWATNICFEGCFPKKEVAERVAARLARLGINCVRMHHMDNYSIWGKSPNKLVIDPEKLARLDYLIYCLKQRGVYTNLNLHVSRWFDEAEGFSGRDERPNYDKGLDNFEPRMIELQKKYAHDLLTHVNPHTKTAYVDEPAVAFIEINNENALFAEWGGGNLDKLPEPYAATFRKQWNAWLVKKHGSTDALRKAWNTGAVPLGGELLVNGGFSEPLDKGWNLERDEKTGVEPSIRTEPQGKGRCLRLAVTRQGEVSWHPQLSQAGFAVKKGETYTLSFRARADAKRQISVNCMMAHEPWERLGFDAGVELGREWRTHRLTFVADRDDPKARITLSSFSPGTYDLADVSLRPGGVAGLDASQRLEDQSVLVLHRRTMGLTAAARRDFVDFLYDTESRYWLGMYRFLKDELGAKPLVAGTQIGYSPARIQASLDYVDAHSYWQHPDFPGRPWDSRDWYVNDLALVNERGGTLTRLAATRVAGMPYTVSEYNHAQPLRHAAEGFPMIAAVGALQAWDGIYSFAYSHSSDFEPGKLDGFFDIKSDPGRMVHTPACAAMFVRGDVAPAKESVFAPLSAEAERRQLHETQSAWTLTTAQFGVDPQLGLLHRIGLDLRKSATGGSTASPKVSSQQNAFVSDTGQVRWEIPAPGRGWFAVDSPRTKLFTGFVGERAVKLGQVSLSIGKTRLDWATVSLTALDADALEKPGRVLVAATGWVQNTGWQLEKLGGNRITLRDRWGKEPVLCEGIPAEIALPIAAERVSVYPLDASGKRRAAIPVGDRNGRAVVKLGPEHKTLWYEMEIR
jgi:hypothetical protein